MREEWIEILKSSGADGWEITDTQKESWEFYFIGHRLDQNRALNTEDIRLKVYRRHGENGEFLGSAEADIFPTEDDRKVAETVEKLLFEAGLVCNRAYRLNQPAPFEKTGTAPGSPAEEARAFLEAMNSVEETENEDLNSYEIFVSRMKRRLVTSEGIDVTEEYPESAVEVVVNARKDGHEIELYRLYRGGACDGAGLKRDVEELFSFGRDRLSAGPTPALGTSPVVFSTDAAKEIYGYFVDGLNAAYLVRHISSFAIGTPVAENITGDRITIEAVRNLPGSPKNFSCDEEGAPVRDLVLMEDSVPKHFVGSRMFSQYLGLEDSFMVTNYRVRGGRESAEELRKGAFLEVVEFSAFEVNPMTGDIFGEIRLGYWHDGKGSVKPVSGGSVSGNMAANLATMRFSKETRRYGCAEIPAVTRLEKLTVAGIA